MYEKFAKARKAGVPILGVCTPDQIATAAKLADADPLKDDCPQVAWNLVEGMSGLNEAGGKWVTKTIDDKRDGWMQADGTKQNPLELLSVVKSHGVENLLMVVHSAHRFIADFAPEQALLNLRDRCKAMGVTVVLIGPEIKFGPALRQHAIILDEPLPGRKELKEIVEGIYKEVKQKPKSAALKKAVAAVEGLVAYQAEQSVALAMTKKGIHIDTLWDIKRRQINETPGLSVYTGGETFDDLGGLDRAKRFARLIIEGKHPPSLVVFIDEIEKAVGGSIGDTSGVSQGILQQELSYMQDREVRGLLFLGHPGCAKSALAKALGNEAGVPTICYDMGGLKGSLVGETEAAQRAAHRVFDSVSGKGDILTVATCNRVASLPPELRRRFNRGTYFFDLPTPAERKIIWEIYRQKFNVEQDGFSGDAGWTGADVRQCCEMADEFEIAITEAANFVIPVWRSAKEQVISLCKEADGRFQSASQETADQHGTYRYEMGTNSKPPMATKRRLKV